jgi:hypothetical protein
MKLPNGGRAIVDLEKLTGYCLNLHHPRGRNKARVFASFGIRLEHAQDLRMAILQAAKEFNADIGELDPFGQRYTIDFDLAHHDKTARIRSTWIVLTGEDTPRLTSCYVL